MFEKKIRILNSLIVPKILKKGTLWDFLTFVLLQNIKKIEKRTLWGHLKNFGKKVSQSRKKVKKFHKAEKSHGAKKSQNLLLRNTCKKISAYPRVRTRNKKQPHFPITLAYRKCNKDRAIGFENISKRLKGRLGNQLFPMETFKFRTNKPGSVQVGAIS